MRISSYLAVGLAGALLGCGPKSPPLSVHDGDYARAGVKQFCYDSAGAAKAIDSAALSNDEHELGTLTIAHAVAELHFNNRAKVLQHDGVYVKVSLETGLECWTVGTAAYFKRESPDDLPATPLSPLPTLTLRN